MDSEKTSLWQCYPQNYFVRGIRKRTIFHRFYHRNSRKSRINGENGDWWPPSSCKSFYLVWTCPLVENSRWHKKTCSMTMTIGRKMIMVTENMVIDHNFNDHGPKMDGPGHGHGCVPPWLHSMNDSEIHSDKFSMRISQKMSPPTV